MLCDCQAKLHHSDGNDCGRDIGVAPIFPHREDSAVLSVLFEEQMTDFIGYQEKRKGGLVPNHLLPAMKKKQAGMPGSEHWFEFFEILEVIEAATMRLSAQQREIMMNFASQSIAHIVGKENFQANPLYFIQLAKIDHIYPFTNCVATRRFGKSKVMSLFAGVCALAAPNVRLTIFSTGLRASVQLLDDTKAYLSGYPDAMRYVSVNNSRNLEFNFGCGDVRRIQSLAGGIKGNKGVGGSILILEELTQIPIEYYFEVILPLMTVDLTTILAITTPKGEDNAHTREFLRQKNSKEKIFNVLEFSLVCEDCKKKGVSIDCQHFMHKLPPWKSHLRQRLLKILMADVPRMYEQEGLGNPGEFTDRCFTQIQTQNIVTNPRIETQNSMGNKIFLSIDLTGGRQSNFAILSLRVLQDSRFAVSTPPATQTRRRR